MPYPSSLNAPRSTWVIFDGQSHNVVPAHPRNYPNRMMSKTKVPHAVVAIGGKSWTELRTGLNGATSLEERWTPYLELDGLEYVIGVLNGGTQDLLEDDDAATIYQQAGEYGDDIRDLAASFGVAVRLIITTIPNVGVSQFSPGFTASQQTARTGFRDLVLEDPNNKFDVSVNLDLVLTDPTNPDQYNQIDRVHLSDSGAKLVAAAVKPAFSAAIYAGPPPIDTSLIRYSSDGPWNTPLDGTEEIWENTLDFSDQLRESTDTPGLTWHDYSVDPDQYAYAVYKASDSDPLVTVDAKTTNGKFSNVTAEDTVVVEGNAVDGPWQTQVRIPVGVTPSVGTDGSIIFINEDTGDEWGFSEFEDDGDGTYSATNGYHYNTDWSGSPPIGFLSRGAGVPYFAGLVTKEEVDAGEIEHALAFGYDWPTSNFVYPASKSDGLDDSAGNVPEGARIKLREDYVLDYVTDPLAKKILRALKRYGAYVVENVGAPKIILEDRVTAGWDASVTADLLRPWLTPDDVVVLDWTGGVESGGFETYPGYGQVGPGSSFTPSILETVTATATGAKTTIASPSITPLANELVVAAFSGKSNRNGGIVSIEGNGLEWYRVGRRYEPQSNVVVEVWAAQGTAPTPGQVTATVTGDGYANSAVAMQVMRLSAGSAIVQRRLSDQFTDSGVVGQDTATARTTLENVSQGNLILGVCGQRLRTFTPGAGVSSNVVNLTVGTSPEITKLSTVTLVANNETELVSGNLSANDEWIMGAFEIAAGVHEEAIMVPASIPYDGSVDVAAQLTAWADENIKLLTDPVVLKLQPGGTYAMNDGSWVLYDYSDVTIDLNGAKLERTRLPDQPLRAPGNRSSYLKVWNSQNITVRNGSVIGVNTSDPAIYQGGPGWESAFEGDGAGNGNIGTWYLLDRNGSRESIGAKPFEPGVTYDNVTYPGRWKGSYSDALAFDHAIDVDSCSNILVEDIDVDGVGGDGAYFTKSEYCTLRRMVVNRNGRQGAAAVSGNHYLFEYCEFWSRRGGIDMEPNFYDVDMSDLEIGHCIFNTDLLAMPSGGPGPIHDVYLHDNLILKSSTPIIYVASNDYAQVRTGYRIEDNVDVGGTSGPSGSVFLGNVVDAQILRNTFPRDSGDGAAVRFPAEGPSHLIEIHDNIFHGHNGVVEDQGTGASYIESGNVLTQGGTPTALTEYPDRSPTTPTGGTIFDDGPDRVHIFTEGGLFVTPIELTDVRRLVVGGGAGGGSGFNTRAAGGGAGGGVLPDSPTITVPAGSHVVVVGPGGRRKGKANDYGDAGEFSAFSYFTANEDLADGGGVSGGPSDAAGPGGSGGGAGGGTGVASGGIGIVGQGFDGGDRDNSHAGAGGGGATGAGESVAASTLNGGDGGPGYQSDISGTLTTYGSGGGGGAATDNVTDGVGGIADSGGGRGGENTTSPTNLRLGGDGVAGTGGGGGGGCHDFGGTFAGGLGGWGGKGVVIIRYPIAQL